MKRMHKILVFVLTLSLLLGVAVVSAFAADTTVAQIGDTEYASISDALAAANAQADVDENGVPKALTITLTKDVTLAAGEGITLELDGLALTIDLGGHTLNVSGVGVIKDPSNIGVPKDREIKAAIYARGEGATLTVKNGVIINTAEKNGVFAVEKDRNSTLAIEDVVVNAKGALNTPLINARGGKVTVLNSELVSYGFNSAVIRQSGNAEVIVEASELFSIDGAGINSTVIKTETNATAILTTEVPIAAADEAAPEENEGEQEPEEPQVEIVERPHVVIKNSELFGASNVIVAYVTGDSRTNKSVNPWLVFEDCALTQANSIAYNAEGKLLAQSNNNLITGNHARIELNDCTAEYARVGFNTGDKLEITVVGGSYSMTHVGQTQYFNEVTQAITECDSYFVMGKGKVNITKAAIFIATLANGKFAPIADKVALDYAKTLDVMSKDGLKIGDGCATNTTEDLKSLDILALACSLHKLAGGGNYIGIFPNTVDNWSGKWYSDNSYEAKLNGVKYKTFKEAYEKAVDGDKIELLADISGMQEINKAISIRNFIGYDIKHTSLTHKSVSSRGFIEFAPAKNSELVEVKLVTNTGVEQMRVAKGNYAVYNGSLAAGWRFSGYKVINFKGWGETPDVPNLGTDLPYIDGSSSSVTVYAVFDELYDLDADYAITDMNGEFIAFGGSYEELAELNSVFMKDKYNAEGAEPKDKVIVLLKDIYTDKALEVNTGGNIYIDLNGHKIVTAGNSLYSSDLTNVIYQYDKTGTTIVRKYTKYFEVYERADENSPWVKLSSSDAFYAKKSADDPQMSDYAVSLGEFVLAEGRTSGGVTAKFYLFSSQPGAMVDTGASPIVDLQTHMRVRMYNADKTVEIINSNTNTNEVYIGNRSLAATMASRVGDNKVTFNCSTFGNYSAIFNYKNLIDDAIIIANSNAAITADKSVGLMGTIELTDSVIVNKQAGASLIQISSLAGFYAKGVTFLATPDGDTYPNFISKLAFHSSMATSSSKREVTGCNFINCKPAASQLTASGTTTILIKDIAYNVGESMTAATVGLVFDAAYSINENAVWNTTVTVGDEVYYLPYKTLFAGSEPETVTVTWCDGEGNPLDVPASKFFKGAKVIYPGALADGTVAGAAYSDVFKFTLTAEGVDLDNIQADANVCVAEIKCGIDAGLEVRHNVNISDELTVSIYVPILNGITKVSLFDPNGENLIDATNVKTINDVEYYVITSVAISPNQIHREIVYAITVSDGEYTDVIYKSVSILGYAEMLLADSAATAEAKNLVSAMLVYANEAYKYFDGEANAAVAALIGEYQIAAPEAQTEKNVAPISDYVLSASLRLKSRVAFMFEVAEGVDALVINGETYAAVDGYVVYDCAVADANDLITIAVNGAEGAYDLVAYIAAVAPEADELTASALASALYSFAVAADAYNAAQ